MTGPLLVFLAFAALGISAMAPSVSFGDSGEFIASAASLAIPHAPGYPLFCLLTRAVGEAFPWANWGYRANLASVLFAAAALAFFYDAARRLCSDENGSGDTPAAVATLFLGLTPLWLHTSLQAEVFSLACFFAAAALWTLCRFHARFFEPRPMAALGLILGLAGANHHTLVLIVPPLLWAGWQASKPRPAEAGRGLAWLLFFAGLGLLVYLYLPIRSRVFPPLDWGHPVDMKRFLHVLLRRDYGSFSLTVEGAAGGRLSSLWPQTLRYISSFYGGFGMLGAGLTLWGLWDWVRGPREDRIGWSLPALWVLLSGPAFLWLGNPPYDAQTSGALHRFHLLSWFGASLLLARGVRALARGRAGRWTPALACAPLLAAAWSAPAWSQRRDFAAYDYGANVLRSLPPGSALFMDGGDDTFYTVAFLQFARGLRPDVDPHDRGGLVFPNPYGADFRRLTKAEKEARRLETEARFAAVRPVYYSTLQDSLLPGHRLEVAGLLRRAAPSASPVPGSEGQTESPEGRALWEAYPRRFSRSLASAHYRYRALVPVYSLLAAAADCARGELRAGLRRLRLVLSEGADVLWVPGSVSHQSQWIGYRASERKDWALAEEAFRLALRAAPSEAAVWLNLGAVLEKSGRLPEAEEAYRRSLSIAKTPQAFHNLGSLYWTLRRWPEAAAAFEEEARLDPASDAVSFALRARAKSKE